MRGITQSATGTVYYPWEAFLTTAQKLHADGYYDAAIVLAHVAVETIVARAIKLSQNVTQPTTGSGISSVAEVANQILRNSGTNVTSDRVRGLYCALTGHAIQQEHHFWSDLKESSERRNHIVHRGRKFGSSDSEASLKAAEACIESVATHNGLKAKATKPNA